MPKQKLLFCTQKVNRDMVRRENRDGVEHIIVKSYTLPPNIVMNGGLYESSEIDKAVPTLNMIPATIEHPMIDGHYVSANDPRVDMDYRFGMWNEFDGKTDDGRIILNKVINVAKASMFEKGKRLLDRLADIETNESAKPMHTSIGVFCGVEDLAEPMVNEAGQEYTWIAKDIIGDHDAFLLDSVGAATPDQGTGIGINSDEEFKVSHHIIGDEHTEQLSGDDLRTNKELSFEQVRELLYKELGDNQWIAEVYDDYFIYQDENNDLFKVLYEIDSAGNASIQAIRTQVDRIVEYKPVNTPDEENAMRDSIIAELAGRGIEVNADITDAELLAKYNEALSAKSGDDNAEVKANSELLEKVNAQAEQIKALEAAIQANQDAELAGKIAQIKANEAYADFSDDSLKLIANSNKEEFDKLVANSAKAVSIGSTALKPNGDNSDELYADIN